MVGRARKETGDPVTAHHSWLRDPQRPPPQSRSGRLEQQPANRVAGRVARPRHHVVGNADFTTVGD